MYHTIQLAMVPFIFPITESEGESTNQIARPAKKNTDKINTSIHTCTTSAVKIEYIEDGFR